MEDYADENTDRILGITRCARCGHRLDGEVDCPFCSAMRGLEGGVTVVSGHRTLHSIPLWVYLTAMLMTFPLSLPWIIANRRLSAAHKAATLLAGVIWSLTVTWFI